MRRATWINVPECSLWCYKLLLWGLLLSSNMLSFSRQSEECHTDQFSFTKKNCSLSSLPTTSDYSCFVSPIAKESVDSFTHSNCNNNFSSKSSKVDIESQLSLPVWRSCSVSFQQNSQHNSKASQQLSYYEESIATIKNWTKSSYNNVIIRIRYLRLLNIRISGK